MSKKKKNRPAATGAHEDIIIERSLKAEEEVHTAEEPSPVYIPDETKTDENREIPGDRTRRFIRTGETPFVSVRGETAKNETKTAVSKFTDRFVTPKGEEQVHTGFTGKMGTYDEVHAVQETDGRMIDPGAFQMRFDVPEEEEAEKTPEKPNDRGSLLREIAGTADEDVRRNPDQMMMEGFEVIGMKTAEELEQEEALKEELDRNREKKIGDFRFWNKKENENTGETEDGKFEKQPVGKALPRALDNISRKFAHLETPFTPVKGAEYEDHNARREGFAAIKGARNLTLLRAGVLALLGLVLLIMDAVAAGNVANNGGKLTAFGGSSAVLAIINLVFAALGALVVLPELKNAVFSILKLHPRTDAVLLALTLTSVLQNALAIKTDLVPQADFRLLTPALLLLAAPYLVSKLFYYDSQHHCFKTVSTKSDKSYLRQVSDPVLAARLNNTDDPDKKALYIGKTRFISNFFARWSNPQKGAEPYGRAVALCLALTGVTAVAAWIIGKSFLSGVSAASLCLSFSFPVCSLLSTGFYLSRRNRALSVKSSFLGSCADATAFTKVENIAADATDLFNGAVTSCLTAKGVTERQVRFVAASIAKGAGGMMKKIFESDIETFDEKIPPSESLHYEEKLGLSAWVGGCKILLGTHDLLTNHSVEVPDENVVTNAIGDGEKSLYLAIEGRFTAVFSVKYTCRPGVSVGVKELVENGTVLTLSTTDANVTDGFAETLLGLPAESVRIMSAAAAESLTAAAAVVTEREDLGAAFGEGFTGLCRTAEAAVMLDKVSRTSRMICTAGAFVSLLLGMILVFTGAYKGTGVWSVLLMQALLTGLCFATPFFGGGLENIRLPKLKLLKKEEPQKEETAEENDFVDLSDVPDTSKVFDEAAPAEKTDDGARVQIVSDAAPALSAEERADRSRLNREASAPVLRDKPAGKAIPDPDLIPEPETVVPDDVTDATDDRAFSLFMKKEDRKPKPKPAEEKRGMIVSDSMKKTFSGIGSFFSSLTDKEERAPEREEQRFTLFGDEKSRRGPSPEEIEQAYEDRKREERDLRSRFTAPEAPEAPMFDLSRKPEPEPQQEDTAFAPPTDEDGVDLFDEDLWSRFEDDKVFAGLHERDEDEDDGSLFDF